MNNDDRNEIVPTPSTDKMNDDDEATRILVLQLTIMSESSVDTVTNRNVKNNIDVTTATNADDKDDIDITTATNEDVKHIANVAVMLWHRELKYTQNITQVT